MTFHTPLTPAPDPRPMTDPRADIAARCVTLIEQEWPRLAGTVAPETHFAEIDLDSFDQMILCLNAEQEFRVEIPDAKLAQIHSARDLADSVNEALKTRQALA